MAFFLIAQRKKSNHFRQQLLIISFSRKFFFFSVHWTQAGHKMSENCEKNVISVSPRAPCDISTSLVSYDKHFKTHRDSVTAKIPRIRVSSAQWSAVWCLRLFLTTLFVYQHDPMSSPLILPFTLFEAAIYLCLM